MLSKLPGEEAPPEQPGGLALEQGHSDFLDSLLGNTTAPLEPAILPAAGQFSLVGCIADSAADVDAGGHEQAGVAGDEAAAVAVPEFAASPGEGVPMPMLEGLQEVRFCSIKLRPGQLVARTLIPLCNLTPSQGHRQLQHTMKCDALTFSSPASHATMYRFASLQASPMEMW